MIHLKYDESNELSPEKILGDGIIAKVLEPFQDKKLS